MYLHIYFSSERALDDEKAFNKELVTLKERMAAGKVNTEDKKRYEKYFYTDAAANQPAIEKAKQNFGYFALISNEIKDPIKALELFRNKDLIEKAFENLKDRLSFKRTLVSSEKSLDGKLFVEFIALIIMSYIKKKMQQAELFRKYTIISPEITLLVKKL